MIMSSLQLRVDSLSGRKTGHLDQSSTQILSRNTTRGIKMKTCTKCHQEKKLTEFYPDLGSHASRCGRKPCCKTCQKKQRKIYLQSRQGRTTTKNYAKTYKSKARQKRYCLHYPERRRAKNAVYWAVKNGILPHPNTKQCLCGNHKAEQYHHHKGYAKKHWLDVVSVCRKYHTRLHRKIAI